jgi:hypothetical protein
MHTGLRDRSSPAEKTEDRSPERARRVRRIDSNKLDRSARGLSTHRPSGLCEIALARAHKPRRCYARTFPWRQARSRCPWRRGRLASPRGSRPLSSGASRPTPTVSASPPSAGRGAPRQGTSNPRRRCRGSRSRTAPSSASRAPPRSGSSAPRATTAPAPAYSSSNAATTRTAVGTCS